MRELKRGQFTKFSKHEELSSDLQPCKGRQKLPEAEMYWPVSLAKTVNSVKGPVSKHKAIEKDT